MVNYITALETIPRYNKKPTLFLAGGITNCPEWQDEMINMLKDSNWFLLNPRRKNFPIHDPNASLEQIHWEYQHLRFADAISFWFCKETLCPIVLYELGAWSMTNKPLFIGIDPDYQRRQDVEIQTSLARPTIKIVYSLSDLCEQINKTEIL